MPYDMYGNKILPSWDEGPMDREQEELYTRQLGALQNSYRSRNSMGDQTPREEGESFARALGTVFYLRSDNQGYSKMLVIARQFAKWAGYRGLDDGSEYIDGFIDGIFAVQPKQITEEKKEK